MCDIVLVGGEEMAKPTENYAEIARQAGVTRSHMSRIMGGKVWPSLLVAEKIARARGVSLSRLFKELIAFHVIDEMEKKYGKS